MYTVLSTNTGLIPRVLIEYCSITQYLSLPLSVLSPHTDHVHPVLTLMHIVLRTQAALTPHTQYWSLSTYSACTSYPNIHILSPRLLPLPRCSPNLAWLISGGSRFSLTVCRRRADAKEPGGPRWLLALAGQSGLPLKGPAEQWVIWPGWEGLTCLWCSIGGDSGSPTSGLAAGGSQGCALCSGPFSSACPLWDGASPLNPDKASHSLCICTAFVKLSPKWQPQTLSPS